MFLYIETYWGKMNYIKEISKIIFELKTEKEVNDFMLEILTDSELETLSKRWRILTMLNEGNTQRKIAKDLNVSLCKVTRGSKILKNKNAVITKCLTKGV